MERELNATFSDIDLSLPRSYDNVVVIPTVRAGRFLRYGRHCYYVYNLKTGKGMTVEIKHWRVILAGLCRFRRANYRRPRVLRYTGFLFQHYHYGFNFLEQIMLMTVPHTVTDYGAGRYDIGLWAHAGRIALDCRRRRAVYTRPDDLGSDAVLGSRTWLEPGGRNLYYTTYSLRDSLAKTLDPRRPVRGSVLKQNLESGEKTVLWEGTFADYLHDILVNPTGQYLVVCELGRFSDRDGQLIPSRVLVLDLIRRTERIESAVPNSAHAQFDPEEPDVLYLSNHNFLFVHTPFWELFKKGVYSLKFLGPASVHKFRVTDAGFEPLAVFTEPDLFRLTNFHVFIHRGRKILAASGAPNFIFLADAATMTLLRRIEVSPAGLDAPCYIGSFVPSPDGEKFFIQATRAFLIVDVDSGSIEFTRLLPSNHTCSNHMIAISRNASSPHSTC